MVVILPSLFTATIHER